MTKPPIQLMVIWDEAGLEKCARGIFAHRDINAAFEYDQDHALSEIYECPPDVIVLDLDAAPLGGPRFARMIKGDHALAHIPLIVRMERASLTELATSESLALDDFILDWDDLEALALRVRLCHDNAARELDANPLSHLGGNNTVIRGIEERLAARKAFAVAYADLDNFKSFNDCYGFLRGDEVIRMTARVITTAVHNAGVEDESLVGHVGGDDFVFIVPTSAVESICENVTRSFDLAIRSFYDEAELQRGGVQATNRKGEPEFFDFMSISIAVAVAKPGEVEHPGQFSTMTGELKKQAKLMAGSNFIIDRRGKKLLLPT